ncbi:MAG: transketolase C-terminal domain-containing protein [bacterium]|nr:transketolase C-terminal domain-containing protein [bacterium]
MRYSFISTLLKSAKKNPRIMLLTGDVGYSVFDTYSTELPAQYLNCGVAEQNMTGVAAGLAIEGKIPFIYSIIPFVTMRNFEQIRNDICYQNLPVKIVGVGSGFSYGPYAHTHHALEDIALMRSLPNMTIFSPSDPIETAFVIRASIKINGPVYIRLGKTGEPELHEKTVKLKVGAGCIIHEGKDIAIFSTGSITKTALDAAKILKRTGINCCVVSMHTLKPLDKFLILKLAKHSRAMFSLEEHSVIGGLGSTIAEILAENQMRLLFRRIGVPDRFTNKVGNQEYMRIKNQLSAKQVVTTIRKSLVEFV